MIIDLPEAEMNGALDSLESSCCSAKNAVLDNTARYTMDSFDDAQSESDICARDSQGASDAQEPSNEELSTSTNTPQLLGPTKCKALVVNYISTGYVLLPYGKPDAALQFALCDTCRLAPSYATHNAPPLSQQRFIRQGLPIQS